METDFKVDQAYKGKRNVSVNTLMYSKNKLLSMLHIKSKRRLNVDVDAKVVSYHPITSTKISNSQIKGEDGLKHSKESQEVIFS